MALNLLINGENRSFEDILKLVLDILKYENIFEVGLVQPLQLGRILDKTIKLAFTFFIYFFVGGFEYILFCWRF